MSLSIRNAINDNRFDVNSLVQLCGESKHIAVYGWAHCEYRTLKCAIRAKIRDDLFQLKKIINKTDVSNLEGRKLERVAVYEDPKMKELWKEILTNIVLENCKRNKTNLPLIPIIFCIDIDENEYPTTAESVFSRDLDENSRITNAELRRGYKLCHDPVDEISVIAKQTFKFVKLTLKDDTCNFNEIKSYWETEQWDKAWNDRIETRNIKNNQNKLDWKTLFRNKLRDFVPQSELIVGASRNEIISLILTEKILFDDLGENWKKDEGIIEAALQVTPDTVMPSLSHKLQLKFCLKDRTLTGYVEYDVIEYFKKMEPSINWDEEY